MKILLSRNSAAVAVIGGGARPMSAAVSVLARLF